MAFCKRNNIWWIRLSHSGKRIQRSTGTSNKLAAQELYELKADLWCQCKLNEKPERLWQETIVKWLRESTYKRSLKDDKRQLKWINPSLNGKKLSEMIAI
jgi:hypothetical protein